jgi:putative acetyltransferase
VHERVRVALERPDQAEVLALIEALDRYQRPLYPPESHHGIDTGELTRPNVLFAVARDALGRAVGCGAIMLTREYGEVKRMFVRPEQRRGGIAKAILARLEAEAIARGCRRFALETGIRQPEALALYERAGYSRCEPFGEYVADPWSVFMSKQVGGPDA